MRVKGRVAMWKLFHRNQALRGMVEISAADLLVALEPFASNPIILDLRGQDEVEHYPYTIPGALLTTKVDVPALIGWLPPRNWVVLCATDNIPRSYSRLHLLRDDLSFCVLSGGLRAWWSAGFTMETVDLYVGGLRTRD